MCFRLLNSIDSNSSFAKFWSLLCDADLLTDALWRLKKRGQPQYSNAATTTSIVQDSELLHTKFFHAVNVIKSRIQSVLVVCQDDRRFVSVLLKQMEYSMCNDLPSQPVLMGISDEEAIDCKADRLRSLLSRLKRFRCVWGRQATLTQRSINIAADPLHSHSNGGGLSKQELQKWILTITVKRDLELKVVQSLERIIRAAELVDLSRFVIRPLRGFEVSFVKVGFCMANSLRLKLSVLSISA